MNQQIKELAELAHEYSYGEYTKRLETETADKIFFNKIFNQKFAELIVRECLSAIDKTNRHHVHTTFDEQLVEATLQKSKKAVKEHFGL